jgi:transposase
VCDNKHMRPFGTSEQLARRRQRALKLLHRGHGLTEVARRVGATVQSVWRWQHESKHFKRKTTLHHRAPGRPSRLSKSQLSRLASALNRGAYSYGYAEDYWTLDRIAHLIWDLFRVRYRTSSVWYMLQRLGWSCQKPQRRSLARDDEAIAHWKHYRWPHIKKVA